MKFPLIGAGYQGRSRAVDPTRLINWFIEINAKGSKSELSLAGSPGTKLWVSTGIMPARGIHAFANYLWVVVGNGLYKISPTGAVTQVTAAAFSTYVGPVVMKDNGLTVSGVGGNQLMIVDGVAGYVYNVVTGAFTPSSSFTGSGFPSAANALEYMDGYFIASQTDSMNAMCSDLYDGTNYDALAISPVQGSSDLIQSIVKVPPQQLFFIKQYSSEIFYNNGVSTAQGFPFTRMASAVIDIGTPSPSSVTRGASSLFMLAQRQANDGPNFIGAVRISNDAPTIISPPNITMQLQEWAPWTDVIGYFHEMDGHGFYTITSPSANQTFVYDASIPDPTMAWHERSSYVTGSAYAVNRHVSNCYAYFAGKHLVGDYRNGNIYEMHSDLYQDNGAPLVAQRIGQELKNDTKSLVLNQLVIDAELGVGGSIAFSFSEDQGATWSSDYVRNLGDPGAYKGILRWRPLGTFPYGMTPRITISDNCRRILTTGYLE